MPTKPQEGIETFPNRNPEIDYLVSVECPEFTCNCPMTGQPDFADLDIRYIPDRTCLELKSLKLYLWSFRDRGVFHEDVVNEIGKHLKDRLSPRYLQVTGNFNIRGGIRTKVEVSFGRSPGERSLNP